jgi:predicted aconitase with swiveling domain
MASIPMVDQPEENVLKILKKGNRVEVDADAGIIKILD